jgi:hypothetical protein
MNTSKSPQDSPRHGNTMPRVQERSVPRLPHEHDESADSQNSEEPQAVIQQAHDDVQRGLVDTDRAPGMGQVYKRLVKDKPKRA